MLRGLVEGGGGGWLILPRLHGLRGCTRYRRGCRDQGVGRYRRGSRDREGEDDITEVAGVDENGDGCLLKGKVSNERYIYVNTCIPTSFSLPISPPPPLLRRPIHQAPSTQHQSPISSDLSCSPHNTTPARPTSLCRCVAITFSGAERISEGRSGGRDTTEVAGARG